MSHKEVQHPERGEPLRSPVVLVTHNPEIAQRCDFTRPMRDGVFV